VIDSLSKTPPTEDEMEKAKTRLEFDFFNGLNSNDEIANLLGEGETDLGAFEKTFELRTKVNKVTAQEVSQAARKWLNPNSRNTVIGQPKAKGAKR
jgi:predicted Zn-dependent peptidase